MLRSIAGRYEGRDALEARPLARSLAREGEPTTVREGLLELAWTEPDEGRRTGTDRTLCLLDGRLTNLTELGRELRLSPDIGGEQLLALAHERRGEAFLERLQGEFVVVIWDRERNRGLIARDQLGYRPMFLSEGDGGLVFASEVRNLLALLARRPVPDRTAVAHWICRTAPGGDATLYEGITRLPAGHLVRLGDGGWERRRYWSPRYGTHPAEPSQADAAAELRAGMAAAVERSLVGAVRPGVLLSGGFDSASVAGLAKSRIEDLAAYSAVFPDEGSADESGRIDASRDGIGLPGVEAIVRGGSAVGGGLEFQAAWQLPSASPNWFLWGPLIRRARGDGVDLLLDGEGGDEVLGCAPYLLADLLRAGRLRSMLRQARLIPGMGSRPRPRWIWRAVARYGARGALPLALHGALRRARGRAQRPPRWLRPELVPLHRATHDPWAWKELSGPRWWAALAHQLTIANDSMQVHDQLRREAALAGLRFGHPLRDVQLIETVLGLPPGLTFHPQLDRWLARVAMTGVVPDRIRLDDEKVHFTTLLEAALSGPDLPVVRELLEDSRAELGAYVRLDVARSELLDGVTASSRPAGWALDLWRLVTLECWLRGASRPDFAERLQARTEVPNESQRFVEVGKPHP